MSFVSHIYPKLYLFSQLCCFLLLFFLFKKYSINVSICITSILFQYFHYYNSSPFTFPFLPNYLILLNLILLSGGTITPKSSHDHNISNYLILLLNLILLSAGTKPPKSSHDHNISNYLILLNFLLSAGTKTPKSSHDHNISIRLEAKMPEIVLYI